MLSRPPQVAFYDDPEHEELWRAVSQLYEDFVGDDEGRIKRFTHVLSDVLNELDPVITCRQGHGKLVNIALEGVHYQCAECKWEPITISGQIAADI